MVHRRDPRDIDGIREKKNLNLRPSIKAPKFDQAVCFAVIDLQQPG